MRPHISSAVPGQTIESLVAANWLWNSWSSWEDAAKAVFGSSKTKSGSLIHGGWSEAFDALLQPNGAYPSLALARKPLARDKLFYSRIALGVKAGPLKALGWDGKPPSWAEIAQAASRGKLRYAMTSASGRPGTHWLTRTVPFW